MIVNPPTRAHGIKIEGMQKEWKKQMQRYAKKKKKTDSKATYICRRPVGV